MIKKRLKEITEIIAGYTFRTALKTEEGGKNLVIQAKDVTNKLIVDESKLANIKQQSFKTNALVRENDVIISARGKFRAGIFKSNLNNVIASSSVYILRLIDENIKPEFLAIYLNSTIGQKEISKLLTGGAIQTILRKDLEDLSVIIPSLEKQKIVIDLYNNNNQMQKLLNSKKEIINNIAERTITNILK